MFIYSVGIDFVLLLGFTLLGVLSVFCIQIVGRALSFEFFDCIQSINPSLCDAFFFLRSLTIANSIMLGGTVHIFHVLLLLLYYAHFLGDLAGCVYDLQLLFAVGRRRDLYFHPGAAAWGARAQRLLKHFGLLLGGGSHCVAHWLGIEQIAVVLLGLVLFMLADGLVDFVCHHLSDLAERLEVVSVNDDLVTNRNVLWVIQELENHRRLLVRIDVELVRDGLLFFLLDLQLWRPGPRIVIVRTERLHHGPQRSFGLGIIELGQGL